MNEPDAAALEPSAPFTCRLPSVIVTPPGHFIFIPVSASKLICEAACKNNDALQKVPMIKQKYEELWNDVSDADRERASVRFVPFNNHI